jgi:hypothetical protein
MPIRTGGGLPPASEASRPGARRARLRFLRIVCPANHPLIEVVPGLDGPVLLLKDATADKTRPATRLSALTAMGPDAAIRCRCECSYHDVPAAWIAVKLGAGVVFVVWGGHGA